MSTVIIRVGDSVTWRKAMVQNGGRRKGGTPFSVHFCTVLSLYDINGHSVAELDAGPAFGRVVARVEDIEHEKANV